MESAVVRLLHAFEVAGCVLLHLQRVSAATTQVSLSITGCDASGIAADRLFELARAEFAPRPLAVDTGSAPPGALRAEIRLCQGSAQEALLVIGNGSARCEQRVDLADVTGDMRARTLAVSLAEFVASACEYGPVSNTTDSCAANPDAISGPPAPGAPHTPQQADVGAALSRVDTARPPLSASMQHSLRTSWLVGAGGALRHYFTPDTNHAGGWLAVTIGTWHAELLVLSSSGDHAPHGSVTTYSGNAAAAYALARLRGEPEVALHARGELGWTWAKGSSSNPADVHASTKSTWQATLALELPARFSVSRRFGVVTRVQGGFSRGLTAQVNERAVATTQGLFAGLTLGVDWKLERK